MGVTELELCDRLQRERDLLEPLGPERLLYTRVYASGRAIGTNYSIDVSSSLSFFRDATDSGVVLDNTSTAPRCCLYDYLCKGGF